MLIVGESLEQLNKEYSIVDNTDCYDITCLKLHLDKTIIIPILSDEVLVYGEEIPHSCMKEMTIKDEGIIIEPLSSILACSLEKVNIPVGYYGFIQTKGSLARYFVSAHFCDGQVDSGFIGKVTFELFNGSCNKIKLHKNQTIANLYIFNTSTKDELRYEGKYRNADKPTIPHEGGI